MTVFLVLPGFTSLQGKFALEIRKALDGLSVLPRELEINVLKFVIKADLAGIRESCAKIDPINRHKLVLLIGGAQTEC